MELARFKAGDAQEVCLMNVPHILLQDKKSFGTAGA
jgi:hypothetical protein